MVKAMSKALDGGMEGDAGASAGLGTGPARDPRDAAMLGGALEAFGRFGYRKCSMEDAARAAGISRQGLYKFFANKEELFRAAVAFGLERRLASTMEALQRGTVEMGVVGALEEWVYPAYPARVLEGPVGAGGAVAGGAKAWYEGGLVGTEMDALLVDAREMAGEVVREWEGRMVAVIGMVIAESEMGPGFARVDVEPKEVARALYAMARGVRGSCGGREAFRREMGVGLRVLWAVGR